MGQDGIVGLVIERFTDRPRTAAHLADLDAVFFGASGTTSFASEAERLAFRERWLGRYLAHDPHLAHLAVSAPSTPQESIAGYIVGSHDDPAQSPRFADLGYFQQLADVTRHYPAQLHVNLAPAWRGRGLGRDLVAAFVGDARASGVPGVHAVTGEGMRNTRFYAACGFKDVGRCVWNGRPLVMLGRALG